MSPLGICGQPACWSIIFKAAAPLLFILCLLLPGGATALTLPQGSVRLQQETEGNDPHYGAAAADSTLPYLNVPLMQQNPQQQWQGQQDLQQLEQGQQAQQQQEQKQHELKQQEQAQHLLQQQERQDMQQRELQQQELQKQGQQEAPRYGLSTDTEGGSVSISTPSDDSFGRDYSISSEGSTEATVSDSSSRIRSVGLQVPAKPQEETPPQFQAVLVTLYSQLNEHLKTPYNPKTLPIHTAQKLLKQLQQLATAARNDAKETTARHISEVSQAADPRDAIAELQEAGLMRVSPPEVQETIAMLEDSLQSPRKFWWHQPRQRDRFLSRLYKRTKSLLSLGRSTKQAADAAKTIWGVSQTAHIEAREWDAFQTLLHLDVLGRTALEAALLGLYGLCRPFFLLRNNESFSCSSPGHNKAILSQLPFITLPEVAKLPLQTPPPVELRCSERERALALESLASPLEKSLQDVGRQALAFLPRGAIHQTPVLDKVSPPWALLRGGLYYSNAGGDILGRLAVFQQVVNALPFNYSQVQQLTATLAQILGTQNGTQAAWLLSIHHSANKPGFAPPLGDLVARTATALQAITGPAGRQTAAWARLQKGLQQIERGVVSAKEQQFVEKQLFKFAQLLEVHLLSSLEAVSLRAVALLICGLWAKEGDNPLDLSSSKPNARVHLLLRLLLNISLHLGTVVFVGFTNTRGGVAPVFAHPKEEIIHFLRSRKASRLQEQEKVALLERVFATVRPLDASSIEVELRCAFTQHRPTLQRILNAAASWLMDELELIREEAVVRTQGRGDLEHYTEIVTGVSLASLRLLRENDSPSAFAASAVDLYSLKGVGEEVAVATDFDDTCVSSGGWRIKGTGTYLGGVDPAFPRGTAYPGFGALLYLLSQGTRRWIGSQRRQVHVQQVLLHQQQQKQLQLVLPVVLASARPSIRIGFRPKSLYRHIAAIYLREAELLGVKRPPSTPIVTYENRVNLIKAAFTGKKGRGRSKFTGLHRLLQNGAKAPEGSKPLFHPETRMIFLGDSYERDLASGLSLAITNPERYVATFLHLVYDSEQRHSPATVPSTFLHIPSNATQLPPGALPFMLPVASASPVGDVEPAITAVSVHFKVSVPKGTWKKLLRSRRSAFAASTAAVAGAPEGLMLPCEALDPTTVWDVSAEVETFIKRVLSAYRHRWVHEGLRDLLETAPLPPPPIFTKCLGVVQGKGPLKVEFLDRKGETRLIPADLGTPVLPYSTTLGAVLLARALGMLDDSDLTDFSVLVARAIRGLHPPSSPPAARAAITLAYDAAAAARLFPVQTAALLGVERIRRQALLSPLGRNLEKQQCVAEVTQQLLAAQGEAATAAEAAAAAAAATESAGENGKAGESSDVSLFANRVCSMKETVANACIASQQELELLAANIGFLSSRLLSSGKCMQETPAASVSSPTNRSSSIFVSYLLTLCQRHPNHMQGLLSFSLRMYSCNDPLSWTSPAPTKGLLICLYGVQ
ncbi:hypothetical protein, conserved [Eimeria maxima]|uniref:Transmembrane protein n=1 Tax=Eimeria maxima TaxID=5804 RepID=U6MFV1_EIMMA|nr:hypothetical protein, conserved [Eimeria maxima]CDJ60515.1 hypothetical protein, conserved [Eimeria maxima]